MWQDIFRNKKQYITCRQDDNTYRACSPTPRLLNSENLNDAKDLGTSTSLECTRRPFGCILENVRKFGVAETTTLGTSKTTVA